MEKKTSYRKVEELGEYVRIARPYPKSKGYIPDDEETMFWTLKENLKQALARPKI